MENLSFGLIALGANLPSDAAPPETALVAAIGQVDNIAKTKVCSVSRIWRTPAFPFGSGPDYANCCAVVQTGLGAPNLLYSLHDIEQRAGRDRTTGRWSSRVIDLDLLAINREVHPDDVTQRAWVALPPDRQQHEAPDHLILPHPRMQDRGFVLAPLAEIAPNWRHPLTGLSVAQMLAALPPDALAGMAPMAPALTPAFAGDPG